MKTQARLREADVIAAQIAALHDESLGPTGEFERGAWTALYWLLHDGPGPVTGEIGGGSRTVRVIVQELAASEALIYGVRSDQFRIDYARGVEHALMWAQFVTCCTPGEIPRQRGAERPQAAGVVADDEDVS